MRRDCVTWELKALCAFDAVESDRLVDGSASSQCGGRKTACYSRLMDHGEFWELDHVGDRELQHELTLLLASSSRTEARIIAHLVAVEERQLHLEAGNRSMFDYCCPDQATSAGPPR